VTPAKVSILDLTVDQIESLELDLGKPVDEWTSLPSRMALYRRVYTIATGTDDATVRAMTLRDLTAAVSLDGEEPGDAETENPTDQPTG
jgi:hypothetical protein